MKNRTNLVLGAVLAAAVGFAPAATSFHPETASQRVSCSKVDQAISKIPRGDGDGISTGDELGQGHWRFNTRGQSFLTHRYTLDPSGDSYTAFYGQSNFVGNRGVVNDYPPAIDVWMPPKSGAMVFHKGKGELVLHGDMSVDPPRFSLPGKDGGSVRIPLRDRDGDGVFEGCASSPFLKNFGFLRPEGGDFLQQMHYKAFAVTDGNGVVTMFEYTEAAVFKNVTTNGK